MIWMFAGMAAQAIKAGMDAQYEARMQDLKNDSLKAYNKRVLLQSAEQINEINQQRAAARAQTGQALDATRRQAVQESSERGLQAAASDTMGASVSQNLDDVQVQLGTALSTLERNQLLQEQSFNSQVVRTTDEAQNNIQDLLFGAGQATMSANLGSMVGQLGTTLASNKMQNGSFFDFGRTSSTQQAGLSTTLGLGS